MLVLSILIGIVVIFLVIQIGGTIAKARQDAQVEWLFNTKVVGVSHRNRDRKSRQKIIKEECSAGDRVTLVPEPENKHDPDAIAVFTRYGSQIGYLDSNVARIAAEKHEASELIAEIIGVHGGEDGHYYGVALKVGKRKVETPDDT